MIRKLAEAEETAEVGRIGAVLASVGVDVGGGITLLRLAHARRGASAQVELGHLVILRITTPELNAIGAVGRGVVEGELLEGPVAAPRVASGPLLDLRPQIAVVRSKKSLK